MFRDDFRGPELAVGQFGILVKITTPGNDLVVDLGGALIEDGIELGTVARPRKRTKRGQKELKEADDRRRLAAAAAILGSFSRRTLLKNSPSFKVASSSFGMQGGPESADHPSHD